MKRLTPVILITLTLALTSRAPAQGEQKLELYLETGHTGSVGQAVFSPDGKTVVSADNGSMKLWGAATGKELGTVVGQAVISPDGKTAVVSRIVEHVLWDLATWRARATLRCPGDFCVSSFSPDGKTLALSGGFILSLWDVASGREIKSLGLDVNMAPYAFSPDGTRLVWWSSTTLSLWDVTSGRELRTMKENLGAYPVTPFSPDWSLVVWHPPGKVMLLDPSSGQELLTLNLDNDGTTYFSPGGKTVAVLNGAGLRLWSVATGRELNGLKGAGINGVALSPDGKTIAFTYGVFNDTSVALLDLESGQPFRVLKEHVPLQPLPVFVGNGKTLALGSHTFGANLVASTSGSLTPASLPTGALSAVSLWEVASGKGLRVLKEQSTLVLSPDGKTAVSWVAGGDTVGVWDTTSWQEVGVLRAGGVVGSVGFHLDGKMILLRSGEAVTVWDAASREKLHTLSLSALNYYVRLVYTPDASAAAVAVNDGLVLWNFRQGQTPRELKRRAVPTNLFALSPDGKTLAAWGMQDGVVKLWEVASGKPPRTIFLREAAGEQKRVAKTDGAMFMPARFSAAPPPARTAAPEPKRLFPIPSSLVFSPDGRMIALWTPGAEDKVILWDVESGKSRHTLDGHDGKVGPIIFSPDGTIVASGGGTVVRLWDAASGAPLRTFKGFEGKGLVYSPNGRMLASWGADHTVKMWNADTGWLLQTVEGHGQTINAVAFADDGKTLASAGADAVIKLWDVTSGQRLRTLAGHENAVASVAFAPGAKVLASESADGTAKLWDAASGLVLKTLKADNPKTVDELYSAVPALYAGRSRAAVTPRGALQVKAVENGKINLFDPRAGKVLVSLISLGNEEWVVTTPEGRFDTNKPLDRIEGLHWIINGEHLRPLPLDVFMRQYYEPELLRRVLSSERFEPLPSIGSINRVQPDVAIKSVRPATDAASSVTVTVEVGSVTADVGAAGGARKGRLSSGVFDVRLFRDGQLVGHSTLDKRLQNTFRAYRNFDEELTVWRQANRVETVNDKQIFTFKVMLPTGPTSEGVEFSAYAFNADRVKSETSRVTYTTPAGTNTQPVSRKAYIITFGVNKFDNPEWDLQFAGNDARAMRDALTASLRLRKEFAEVVGIHLISDDETADISPLEKRDATKSNVQTVLELLAGKAPPAERLKELERSVGAETLRRVERAVPDDMVLISFSTHGYADRSGVFYVVPSDIGSAAGKRVTPGLLRRLISSDELSLWMRDIDAGELVMIVDACHSASAVEGGDFKPGPMGSRGLGQLAFDKGMRILTATQADDVALENKIIRQGLLTYALIQDGIKSGQADYKPKDKVINIGEWLSYGVERVPKLYEEVRSGSVQGFGKGAVERAKVMLISPDRAGSSRTLVEVLTEARAQQPALFDFTRKRREVALVNLQ